MNKACKWLRYRNFKVCTASRAARRKHKTTLLYWERLTLNGGILNFNQNFFPFHCHIKEALGRISIAVRLILPYLNLKIETHSNSFDFLWIAKSYQCVQRFVDRFSVLSTKISLDSFVSFPIYLIDCFFLSFSCHLTDTAHINLNRVYCVVGSWKTQHYWFPIIPKKEAFLQSLSRHRPGVQAARLERHICIIRAYKSLCRHYCHKYIGSISSSSISFTQGHFLAPKDWSQWWIPLEVLTLLISTQS